MYKHTIPIDDVTGLEISSAIHFFKAIFFPKGIHPSGDSNRGNNYPPPPQSKFYPRLKRIFLGEKNLRRAISPSPQTQITLKDIRLSNIHQTTNPLIARPLSEKSYYGNLFMG